MEHIPRPRDGRFGALNLVYRGEQYDRELFRTYPERRGFDINQYRYIEDAEKDPVPFLHTWLYFGVISDFFVPMQPPQSDFLRTGGYLTTEKLRVMLYTWFTQYTELIGKLPHHALVDVLLERRRMLETVGRVLLDLRIKYTPTLTATGKSREMFDVVLSVSLLGECLYEALRWTAPHFHEAFSAGGSGSTGELWQQVARSLNLEQPNYVAVKELGDWEYQWTTDDDMLPWEMADKWWCPSEKARFSDLASASVKLFLFMTPLDWRQKHHTSCTAARCIADDIDESNYRTRHVKDGCRCALIGPRDPDLRKILDSGQSPIIRLVVQGNPDGDGNATPAQRVLKLEAISMDTVRSGADFYNFVAISHVWSDGMGNVVTNRLPNCQLIDISNKCRQLVPEETERRALQTGVFTVSLWVDTLCIPLEPSYRKLAISRMNLAYERAACVLVVSRELREIESDMSPEDFMFRIVLSGWNHRAWTLLEAMKAGEERLHFGLKSMVAQGSIVRDLATMQEGDDGEEVPFLSLARFAVQYGNEADSIRTAKTDQGKMVKLVWDSLRRRSTSKKTDLVLIAALILGVPADTIMNEPSKELPDRLAALYPHLTTVPSGVIFMAPPKLHVENLRWAPASIAQDCWDTSDLHNTPRGTITPSGRLRASYDGFILGDPSQFSSKIQIRRGDLSVDGMMYMSQVAIYTPSRTTMTSNDWKDFSHRNKTTAWHYSSAPTPSPYLKPPCCRINPPPSTVSRTTPSPPPKETPR